MVSSATGTQRKVNLAIFYNQYFDFFASVAFCCNMDFCDVRNYLKKGDMCIC